VLCARNTDHAESAAALLVDGRCLRGCGMLLLLLLLMMMMVGGL